MNDRIKMIVNRFLDLFLFALALLLLVAMARDIHMIFSIVFGTFDDRSISILIQEVLTFFMLFEFMILLFRYIQEGHHIPIRYLVYICITAVLRQILSAHGPALEILLYAIAILLLVATLILTHFAMSYIRGKKDKTPIGKVNMRQEMDKLLGDDLDLHG
ncbi:protein PsiE [Pilibacter termitis]|uniref:Protein PsiE n=1 Tax=Pilibacter termitis TaxID=263852 RepID=A0A1T4QEY2_9ENTE|nr:phosphate-starvation-inducible PsiE family protein [Pilibacter termitis]SKA02265.1 protein PsiE [Pilibacter termitis]